MVSSGQKRFILLSLGLFISATLFVLMPALKSDPFFDKFYSNDISSYTSRINKSVKRTAFATVLCDTSMTEAVLVSIYSLKTAMNTSSSPLSSDILVVVPDTLELPDSVLTRFKILEIVIIKGKVIHEITKDSCGTALTLWTLEDYEKIVYFSPNVFFRQDPYPLLEFPRNAAMVLPDNHEPIYGSLIAIEPSRDILEYAELYAKNKQRITISEYLRETILSWDQIIMMPLSLLDEDIYIFRGTNKPWNFHKYSKQDWKSSYEPIEYYSWRQTHSLLKDLLITDYPVWPNQNRQRDICDKVALNSTSHTFPLQNKFSVLLSTYNPERIEHISLLIRHLLRSSKVHAVYVTWHNPALEVPPSLLDSLNSIERERVHVLRQAYDSLNNRFNPIPSLLTDSVYIMDDDIFMDLGDLEFTYQTWQTQKDHAVGHFPRYHTFDPDLQIGTYKVPYGQKMQYSMVLTKSMFVRSDYLFAYTCLLDQELHRIIDERLNCEDIAFSMMATGWTGAGPTSVTPQKPVSDFGLDLGISLAGGHMDARAECIVDFIGQFWDGRDPLIMAYSTVVPYRRTSLRRGKWETIKSQISKYGI
ncbi:glycosyl transferase family 64 domain-containing protein [Phycomyces nitens]|nr:glycosyl transferase family 64 domain-containing protein [Phycomyces nitens]